MTSRRAKSERQRKGEVTCKIQRERLLELGAEQIIGFVENSLNKAEPGTSPTPAELLDHIMVGLLSVEGRAGRQYWNPAPLAALPSAVYRAGRQGNMRCFVLIWAPPVVMSQIQGRDGGGTD